MVADVDEEGYANDGGRRRRNRREDDDGVPIS